MSTDIQLDEKIKVRIKEPSNYKVVMLNDDYTPMDFVIAVLMDYFKHTESTAIFLTNQIHSEGSGVAGIYTYEIAEQKALEVSKLAQSNGWPLQLKLEEE